jgi:hypothetical protein
MAGYSGGRGSLFTALPRRQVLLVLRNNCSEPLRLLLLISLPLLLLLRRELELLLL